MRLVAIAAALAAAGFSVVRDPSSDQPIRWPGAAVQLRLHEQGSADVADGSDLLAMRAAMAAWSAPAGLTLTEGPLVSAPRAAEDGENIVSFFEQAWPAPSGVVALTIQYRDFMATPQRWREADVLVNGQDFRWGTDGDLHAYDVQSVVTHELGHVLGLHHAAKPEATMFFASRVGMTYGRTLSADDLSGVRYLYPGGAFACASDADCPLLIGLYGGPAERRRCVAGGCGATGAVGYGLDCMSGTDCASGLCIDDPEGPGLADPGFCSASCGSCPEGDLCATGLCLLAREDCSNTGSGGDAQCGGAGDNEVCTRDIDGYYRCNHLCLSDANCGSLPGTRCWFGVDAASPGFCLMPGPTASGACDGPFDCASLLCTVDASGAALCAEPGAAGDDSGPEGGDSGPLEVGDSGATAPADEAGQPGGDGAPVEGESRVGARVSGCACSGGRTAWAALLAAAAIRRGRLRGVRTPPRSPSHSA